MRTFREAHQQLMAEELFEGVGREQALDEAVGRALTWVREKLGNLITSDLDNTVRAFKEIQDVSVGDVADDLDRKVEALKAKLGEPPPEGMWDRIVDAVADVFRWAAKQFIGALGFAYKTPVGPSMLAGAQATLMWFFLATSTIFLAIPMVGWAVVRVAEGIIRELEEHIGEGATMGVLVGGVGVGVAAGLPWTGAVLGGVAGRLGEKDAARQNLVKLFIKSPDGRVELNDLFKRMREMGHKDFITEKAISDLEDRGIIKYSEVPPKSGSGPTKQYWSLAGRVEPVAETTTAGMVGGTESGVGTKGKCPKGMKWDPKKGRCVKAKDED